MRTHIDILPAVGAWLLLAAPTLAQEFQWLRHIGGQGMDFGRVSAEDDQGNFYVLVNYAGDTQGNPFPISHNNCYVDGDTVSGNADSFIAKYDPNGSLVWLKSCVSPGGAGLIDMVVDTTSQALYVVGTYQGSCQLDTVGIAAGAFAAAMLSRWTYDGACVWAKNVATSGTDLFGSQCFMRSIALSAQGQLVVSGSTTQYTTTYVNGQAFPFGSFLAGFDLDGGPLWARPFVQEYDQGVYPVFLASRGAFTYALSAYDLDVSDTISVDTITLVGEEAEKGYFLTRLNTGTGDFQWLKRSGIGCGLMFNGQVLTTDGLGAPVIGGLFNDSAFFDNDTLLSTTPAVWSMFIAAHDTSGQVVEAKAFHAPGGVMCESVASEPGGGFYATGYAWPGTSDWDGIPFEVANIREVFVSKHAADGTCLGVFTDGSGRLNGSTVLPTTNGLYLGLYFSEDQANGTVTLGDSSFTSYGYRDVLIAKLDQVTGITPFRGAENNALHIYANPNNGLCTIDLPQSLSATDDLVLSVYDNTGQLVQRVPLEFTDTGLKLDVRAQAKGIYHVELGDGEQRYTGTIVFE
ncbi:MAG: T9SS type A sorting domain-containing protein [Flavobacteriales bacterium]|nr:MAG: T9SS type A sorting domain-containing protein [Flavobacteriales bacterium]